MGYGMSMSTTILALLCKLGSVAFVFRPCEAAMVVVL